MLTHPLNEDEFSTIEDPKWGGRYRKNTSQAEAKNRDHIQEAIDAIN